MEVTFQTSGWDDIILAMGDFKEKTKDSLLKTENRRLMKKYIITPLKASLPYSSETKEHLIITSVKGDKTAVSGGFGTDAYYVQWPEFGTKERYFEGAYRGKVVAQNRVSPIIDSNVPKIVKEWSEEGAENYIKTIERRTKAGRNKLKKLGG